MAMSTQISLFNLAFLWTSHTRVYVYVSLYLYCYVKNTCLQVYIVTEDILYSMFCVYIAW